MADPFDNLPPKLTADLKRAVDRPVAIPADVDAAIVAMGRRHAAIRRRFGYWRATIGSLAAAAMLALGWILWPGERSAPQMAIRPQVSPMDLDASGRVDILDAYTLAKQLPAGRDVNGDGNVDQADVDAIARVAVDLKGGRP